jgi:hypothetical protein
LNSALQRDPIAFGKVDAEHFNGWHSLLALSSRGCAA